MLVEPILPSIPLYFLRYPYTSSGTPILPPVSLCFPRYPCFPLPPYPYASPDTPFAGLPLRQVWNFPASVSAQSGLWRLRHSLAANLFISINVG